MVIGAQLYTVRDFCKTQEDFENTLRRCAEQGYKTVQLSGPSTGYDPTWTRSLLDKYHLEAPITHTPYDRLKDDIDQVIKDHKILGAHYVGLGCPPDFKNSGCNVDLMNEKLAPLEASMEKIHDAGLQFMYHNHNKEFAMTPDGKCILQYLTEKYPAELMGFTLDTYWVVAGGGDPGYWLEKLSGRVDCIHFKDMFYSGEDQAVRMAAIGKGNMNYPAILAAAHKAGTKYAFVEQDHCYDDDCFDCLKVSLDNLCALGEKA